MVDFIEDIYKYAKLIPDIKNIIEMCRQMYIEEVKLGFEKIATTYRELCQYIVSYDQEMANELWSLIEQACSHTTDGTNNYLLMADDLERLIPKLYQAMSVFGEIDVAEGDYRIVSSSSGFLTLQNINTGSYIHSSLDPVTESNTLAKRIHSVMQQDCKIFGCGLGYLAEAMYRLSQERFDIYIYETNEELVNYAYDYGVLSLIPEDKLHVVIDADEDRLVGAFLQDIDEGMRGRTAYYCYDDIYGRMHGKAKDIIAKMSVVCSNYYMLKERAEINFYRNIINIPNTIYDIHKKVESNDWIVVGGGPSVDSQIEYLRACKGKKNIIAASTVYKKLVNLNIIPDYVAVLDPKNRTFGHFEGVQDNSADLVVSAIACWEFAEYYKGDKYYVPCTGQEVVTSFCESRGIKMIDTGSTIPVMCMNVAVTLGAKNIDLIGLDLAYPTNASHAVDTMDYMECDRASFPDILSVDGGMVKTEEVFIYYLREAEKIINDNKQVRFINYSDHGAAINGAVWYKDLVRE